MGWSQIRIRKGSRSTQAKREMLEKMRALAWRKESTARAIFRIVNNLTFAEAVKSASAKEHEQALKYIEIGNVDDLQDWVKGLTRDLSNSELKYIAGQMGIRGYSRMNTAQLRRAVNDTRTSGRSVRDSGQVSRNTSGSGLQASGCSLQSKEA